MSTPDPKSPDAPTQPPQWLIYVFLGPMVLVALAGIVALVVTLLPRSA